MIVDFHRWRHDEAIEELHKIIGRVRLDGKPTTIDFVVGHGSIREDLVETLKAYGLSPGVKLTNQGVITVTVE